MKLGNNTLIILLNLANTPKEFIDAGVAEEIYSAVEVFFLARSHGAKLDLDSQIWFTVMLQRMANDLLGKAEYYKTHKKYYSSPDQEFMDKFKNLISRLS